jgi:endoglycosylceramidase
VLAFHNSVLPDNFTEPYYYDKKIKEIERLGVAGAVTETNNAEGEIKFLLGDYYGLSWMHWAYKRYAGWTWDSSGLFDSSCTSSNIYDCVHNTTVRTFARTYPHAVAGKTLNFTYNDTTTFASLEYVPKEDCKLPTEIFVSESWVYTNGFEVDVEGDLASHVTWTNPKKNFIFVTVAEEFFEDD